jgi:hypothetical protein
MLLASLNDLPEEAYAVAPRTVRQQLHFFQTESVLIRLTAQWQ